MATLPNLLDEQHAQILGYSIIAYGVSFLVDLIDPIVKMTTFLQLPSGLPKGTEVPFSFEGVVWKAIVVAIVWFIACLISGSVIKNRDVNPRGYALLFVMMNFGSFPLGTILSFYTLIYLFVIYQNEGSGLETD